MTTYIALLRGINVGGKNKIKMAELKSALEALGLDRVQTYIQSGNVLFESDETEVTLRERLERQIAASFGVPAAVVLRTAEEWERLVAECPFEADRLPEGESLQICLLGEAPQPDKIALLSAVDSRNDEFRIRGRDVYVLLRQSILDSKLASSLPKLGVVGTVRNWNTVKKLASMANGADR